MTSEAVYLITPRGVRPARLSARRELIRLVAGRLQISVEALCHGGTQEAFYAPPRWLDRAFVFTRYPPAERCYRKALKYALRNGLTFEIARIVLAAPANPRIDCQLTVKAAK